jgi:acyl carrier protein
MQAQDRTPIEKTVTEIWSEVLKTDDIRPDDDFFDLGGTSLGLISVVMKMSERFGVPLDTGIVTKGATVASLAGSVREKIEHASPQSPIEKAVAKVWAEVLKTDDIGLHDDFFDLGGTSLGLISVVMKMSERFAVPLETSIVTQGATVASLASAVNEKLSNTTNREAV